MSYLVNYLGELGIKEDQIIWILIFLITLFIVLLVLLYSFLRPKYLKYIEDSFYNLKWKWNWKKGKISSLWAYCPDCDSSLICDDESCKNHNNLKDKITFFICQNCNESEKGRVIGGNREYVLKIIEREIMKKVSKGDFETEKDGV